MKNKKKDMKRIFDHMELVNAPEGFTDRLMNRIMVHPRHSKITYQPLIPPYAWIIIVLVIAALIFVGSLPTDPAVESDGLFGLVIDLQPIYDWLGGIMTSFKVFNDLSILVYLFIGVLLSLFLVDELVLKRVYRRN